MGIIIAGALVLSNVGDIYNFVENKMIAPPVVLIVTGTIVFLVAFLGCFGAIRESYNILIAVSIRRFDSILLIEVYAIISTERQRKFSE